MDQLTSIPVSSQFMSSSKWIEFLNRQSFIVTQSSRLALIILIRNLFVHTKRPRLKYSLNPIATIQPLCIPKSQAVMPKYVRKLPKVRIFQQDQMQAFKSKFACNNKTQVVKTLLPKDLFRFE